MQFYDKSRFNNAPFFVQCKFLKYLDFPRSKYSVDWAYRISVSGDTSFSFSKSSTMPILRLLNYTQKKVVMDDRIKKELNWY